MAPQGKPSASTATRKKQAKKAALKTRADPDHPSSSAASAASAAPPLQRGQKKSKADKKAPKIKQFIPPPPPPRGEPDPVDRLGLGTAASAVGPERVISLRRVAKRDAVTVARGLEEWQEWASDTLAGGQDREALLETLPVWVDHFPRVVAHPSRRVRALAVGLHSALLGDSQCRECLLAPAELERQPYIGGWLVAAFDADRAVRRVAERSWQDSVLSGDGPAADDSGISLTLYTPELLNHLLRLIFASAPPAAEPPEGTAPPPHASRKPEDLPESARKVTTLDEPPALTRSRLRASALDALGYLLRNHPHPESVQDPGLGEVAGRKELWQFARAGFGPDAEEAAVRRAVWGLLSQLASERHSGLLQPHVPLVSRFVLPAAFAETDPGTLNSAMAGLIPFLRLFPEAWGLADRSAHTDDSSSDEESESEGNDEVGVADGTANSVTAKPTTNLLPILQQFLTYLTLGCSGAPVALYPATLLLLSTIPPDVVKPSSLARPFFVSWWAAADGRVLDGSGPKAFTAFCAAWAECLLWFAPRLQKGRPEEAAALVQEEVEKMWDAYSGSAPKGRFSGAGTALLELALRLPEALGTSFWSPIEGSVKKEVAAAGNESGSCLRLVAAVDVISLVAAGDPQNGAPEARAKAVAMLSHLLSSSLASISEDPVHETHLVVITALLSCPASAALTTSPDADALREHIVNRLPDVTLAAPPPLRRSALRLWYQTLQLSGEWARLAWPSLMNEKVVTNQHLGLLSDTIAFLAGEESIAASLPEAGLDHFVLQLASDTVMGPAPVLATPILCSLLKSPAPFISTDSCDKILRLLADKLESVAEFALYTDEPLSDSAASNTLRIAGALGNTPGLVSRLARTTIPATAFETLFFTPLLDETPPTETIAQAQNLVDAVQRSLPRAERPALLGSALRRLQRHLLDPKCRANGVDLAVAARTLVQRLATPDDHAPLVSDFLPDRDALDSLLAVAQAQRPAASLAVVDPMVFFDHDDAEEDATQAGDACLYIRVGVALLDIAMTDRTVLKQYVWILRHALFLAQWAHDQVSVQDDVTASEQEARAVAFVSDQAVTYMLSALAQPLTANWHAKAISHLRKPQADTHSDDVLIENLAILAREAGALGGQASARSFARALTSILRYSDAGTTEAERWLALAQDVQERAPLLALALVNSSKEHLYASTRFQRYQNELASKLSGVAPGTMHAQRLALIRLLCATAPPTDSSYIFVSPQRSIALLQAFQKWVHSDDDIEDEVNAKMLELFSHLAPVVQTMSGAHWDLMLDLVESNLEVADWNEPDSLPALYQSCRLLQTLRELSKSNGKLRGIVSSHMRKCLALLQPMYVSRPTSTRRGSPADMIAELAIELLRDIPTFSEMLDDALPSLVPLFSSPSVRARTSAYAMAEAVLKKHMEDLVIEAELEAHEGQSHQLPQPLIEVLAQGSDDFAALLAWSCIISLFESGSARLRTEYNAQIRNSGLVSGSLLPVVFKLLDVSDRGLPFPVALWAVEEHDVSLLDGDPASFLPLLAASVYYRALQSLPSHIRAWLSQCRNKQLSMAVSSFTSRYFSPLLIASELNRLKDPAASSALKDEKLSVKVSPSIGEVRVTYVVDDESMEISMRMPSEYPLSAIEIAEVRKVGVPETQWRAWLLAAQQIVTTQNGSIVEALGLFKRNVSLHFDGVEACAICYSVISVTDRSLPRKSCRTCHNKFHPSCLFKWFSTSHGSSCPLCRSLF